MPRNQRQPFELAEQAQIQRLILELGEAATASALGVNIWTARRAAEGLPMNQTTRDRVRASAWLIPIHSEARSL